MDINTRETAPLHVQAERYLRQLIASDEYRNGKLLPNEVELSAQLNISRNTLRQALNTLVQEGLLIRKKGVGTKVAKKSIRSGAKNWRSFSQEMRLLGIEVKNFELHVSHRRPSEAVASFFGIKDPETRCVVLERVRGKKEYPFVSFISWFNPELPLTGEENFNIPLYELLERGYGVVVNMSKEEISAGLAGEELARKLEISPADPILIRKRFVYDENGVPVEYNVGYYRADSFTYTIEATR